MKRINRIVSLLLSVMLVSVLVSSFVLAGNEKATLTVWLPKTFSSEGNNMLAQHFEDFGKANNCIVNVDQINSSDVVQKHNSAVESGKIPDVINLYPWCILQYLNRGLLMDITDVFRDIEKNESPFALKSTIDFATFNKKIYALPLFHENRVLIYRKDLLAKAGYKEPPQTWDELRKIAKAVTDPAKNIYGFGEAFAPCGDTHHDERGILWSYGAKEVSTDGKKVAINSPKTLRVIKLLADMYLKDKSIPPTAVSWDDSGNNSAYLSGQCAMVINPPTILGAMTSDQKELKENTGVAPVPAGPKGRFVYGGLYLYGCYSKTKYPDLAKKLLRSIYDVNWYGDWVVKTAPALGPVLQKVTKNSFWQSGINKTIIDAMQCQKHPGYPGPMTIPYSQYESRRMWGAMMQKVMVNKVPPKQALKELETEMKKIYKKYK